MLTAETVAWRLGDPPRPRRVYTPGEERFANGPPLGTKLQATRASPVELRLPMPPRALRHKFDAISPQDITHHVSMFPQMEQVEPRASRGTQAKVVEGASRTRCGLVQGPKTVTRFGLPLARSQSQKPTCRLARGPKPVSKVRVGPRPKARLKKASQLDKPGTALRPSASPTPAATVSSQVSCCSSRPA